MGCSHTYAHTHTKTARQQRSSMKLESTALPTEITNVFCRGIDCAYRSTQLASKALPRLIVGKKFLSQSSLFNQNKRTSPLQSEHFKSERNTESRASFSQLKLDLLCVFRSSATGLQTQMRSNTCFFGVGQEPELIPCHPQLITYNHCSIDRAVLHMHIRLAAVLVC